MLLVKPLLLKSVNKPKPGQSAHGHGTHGARDNEFIDHEFSDEDTPLLARPARARVVSKEHAFCFDLCGTQGVPGGDDHGDGEHHEVCRISDMGYVD